MARVTITTDAESKFAVFIDNVESQLYDALAAGVARVVAQGAEEARKRTDRIDTGLMISMIGDQVSREASAIVGEFGFVGLQADYFIYQTVTGFTHWLSGDMIEPTFAIRDAGELAKQDMIAAISEAIRSVRV